MNNEQKRALEIYISLIIQQIRKENNKALEQIKAFFYAFEYKRNYDPEFLYQTCIDNIETITLIPKHGEILMASEIKEKPFNYSFKTFKPYYRKKLTKIQLRQQQFSINKIMLIPKIHTKNFHEQLLTFLTNFVILSKNIPIRSIKNVK